MRFPLAALGLATVALVGRTEHRTRSRRRPARDLWRSTTVC